MRRSLSYSLVTASGGSPESWFLMLHGAFGTGRNWGTVARELVKTRPRWGVVLADLRMHGASQGFPPPHTLKAAASDLDTLAKSLGTNVSAVLGHSFGGKVALVYAKDPPEDFHQAWIIDSSPSAIEPSGSAWQMLQAVRSLPQEFSSREEAIAGLGRSGFARRVAQWMATNLESRGGRYRWRLDFDALEEMLLDFFQTELWSVVENPPSHVEIHFVKGAGSNELADADVLRLQAIARANPRVFLHGVLGGHWLNADNPDAVVRLLSTNLR